MGSCNPCNPVHGDLPPRCFINNIKPVIWWKSFLWVTPLIHFDRGLYIWKWRKKEKKILGLDWKKTTFYNCTLTLSNTHTQGDTHTHTHSDLLCHFVDDGCKIGGSVQLHGPQALEVSLQDPLYAHTVWTLVFPALQQATDSSLIKRTV